MVFVLSEMSPLLGYIYVTINFLFYSTGLLICVVVVL